MACSDEMLFSDGSLARWFNGAIAEHRHILAFGPEL
jgi:hypothetical protein